MARKPGGSQHGITSKGKLGGTPKGAPQNGKGKPVKIKRHNKYM